MAVTKPGGLLVHRSAEARRDRVFLLQTLARRVGQPVYPVHRLDRAASGAIVFGLDSAAARGAHDALKRDDARKIYLALVRGETPAAWSCGRSLKNPRGVRQESRSTFETLARFVHDPPVGAVDAAPGDESPESERYFRLSLVQARIFTGRRHQIRRHLHHAAHQVLGDTTYGKGRINRFFREHYGLPRLFLHAAELRFDHPATGEPLVIRSPLPDDLRAFVLRLPGCQVSLHEHL